MPQDPGTALTSMSSWLTEVINGFIDIGQLKSSVGLDGRFAIHMSADLSFLLNQGREIWLVPPQIDAPRRVHVEGSVLSGDALTVGFEEIRSIDLGERLIGCHCLIEKDEDVVLAMDRIVPDRHLDMIGWSFFDERAGIHGAVSDAYDSAGQLMLEVEHDGGKSLVPYSEDFVESLDGESKSMVFTCPSGLFDL